MSRYHFRNDLTVDRNKSRVKFTGSADVGALWQVKTAK
jgi:hypothetical protein